MMNLLEKISGVKDFSTYDNNLVYLSNECKIPYLPSIDIDTIVTDKKYPGEIFIIGDFLVWQDMYGKSVIYDLRNKSILFENNKSEEVYTFRRLDLIQKGLLVVNRRINGQKKVCFFNIYSKDFEPINREIQVSTYGGMMLNIDKESTTIARINLEGKELWSFSVLGKYTDIRGEEQRTIYMGTLGLHYGILWIWLSSGELIGLDEKTGELVKKIGLETSINNEKFKFGGAMQIDANTASLIGLWSKYYIEVHLNDPRLQVKYTSLAESLESSSMSISFRSHNFPYDAKSIYFCDDRQGKIGVFDRDKKEVVWSYELEMKREGVAQILEMKYSKNRLYVLDRNNTLHIFEKE
jgi:outer membrane protein assembly factor BamB